MTEKLNHLTLACGDYVIFWIEMLQVVYGIFFFFDDQESVNSELLAVPLV